MTDSIENHSTEFGEKPNPFEKMHERIRVRVRPAGIALAIAVMAYLAFHIALIFMTLIHTGHMPAPGVIEHSMDSALLFAADGICVFMIFVLFVGYDELTIRA